MFRQIPFLRPQSGDEELAQIYSIKIKKNISDIQQFFKHMFRQIPFLKPHSGDEELAQIYSIRIKKPISDIQQLFKHMYLVGNK